MKPLFTSIEPWIGLTGLFLFLLGYGITTIYIVNRKKQKQNPRQTVALYMALKVVRLLVFIGAMLVYMLVIRIETKRFILVSAALYCIYLLLDTLYLTYNEKRMKTK